MNDQVAYKLSDREMQVAKLIAWGYIKKEIADMLNISFHTVSQHVRNIYEKLDVCKETDLARWYLFQEYGIADNPFKKVLAVVMLVISINLALGHADALRVVRTCRAQSTRVMRASRSRSRRSKEYHLQLSIA